MMYMCHPRTCCKFEMTWKGVNYVRPRRLDIFKAWLVWPFIFTIRRQGLREHRMKATFPLVLAATLLHVLVQVSETEGQLSFNTKLGRSLYNVSMVDEINLITKIGLQTRLMFVENWVWTSSTAKKCSAKLLYTIVPSTDGIRYWT